MQFFYININYIIIIIYKSYFYSRENSTILYNNLYYIIITHLHYAILLDTSKIIGCQLTSFKVHMNKSERDGPFFFFFCSYFFNFIF
jgi:hypothetical protein